MHHSKTDTEPPQTETGEEQEELRVVGKHIRELRKAKRMTLKEVALASRLSPGYISLIERDQCVPSIRALHDLAKALDISISWFFPDQEARSGSEQETIVRKENRRVLKFDSGIRDELLSPTLGGELELLSCYFEPGAVSGQSPYSHESEEAGVIISGQLTLWVDGEQFDLKAGDSFQFDSRKPHRYCNPGETQTHVIWAITPPTY